MKPDRALYLGVMTGTSLDGADCVLADLSDFPNQAPRVLAETFAPYPAELKAEMLALQAGVANELHRSRLAGQALSRFLAQPMLACLAKAKLAPNEVMAAGVHGQTVRHQPLLKPTGYSVQLLEPALLAELTGLNIACDFRSRDLAAGGQGAPLVPAFHRALVNTEKTVAILNIGGFANVSVLQASGAVIGFDTGPGNVLLDAWTQKQLGRAMDENGAWAAGGEVNAALLMQLLSHPFFALPAPKSTGREDFDLTFLEKTLKSLGAEIAPQNIQATLLQLTAQSVAAALSPYAPQAVYVCGGGALNGALMQALARQIKCELASTAALGVAPMQMEALAFAWLAKQCLEKQTANIPAVTGAAGARILGAVYYA